MFFYEVTKQSQRAFTVLKTFRHCQGSGCSSSHYIVCVTAHHLIASPVAWPAPRGICACLLDHVLLRRTVPLGAFAAIFSAWLVILCLHTLRHSVQSLEVYSPHSMESQVCSKWQVLLTPLCLWKGDTFYLRSLYTTEVSLSDLMKPDVTNVMETRLMIPVQRASAPIFTASLGI